MDIEKILQLPKQTIREIIPILSLEEIQPLIKDKSKFYEFIEELINHPGFIDHLSSLSGPEAYLVIDEFRGANGYSILLSILFSKNESFIKYISSHVTWEKFIGIIGAASAWELLFKHKDVSAKNVFNTKGLVEYFSIQSLISCLLYTSDTADD